MTIVRVCACGCGQPTKPLRKKVRSSSGVRHGEPAKFLQGHFAGGRRCDPATAVATYRSGKSLSETAEILGVSVSEQTVYCTPGTEYQLNISWGVTYNYQGGGPVEHQLNVQVQQRCPY